MGGDGIAEDRRQPISPALVKVQRREIVIRDRHDHPRPVLAAGQQLGFGHQVPAHAGPLMHRIRRQREDVQGAVEGPPRQRARDPAVGLRNERRSVVERDRFAVRNEPRGGRSPA
jgi:hypothetical protein